MLHSEFQTTSPPYPLRHTATRTPQAHCNELPTRAPLQLCESEAETLEKLSRLTLHSYVAQYEEFERARAAATTVNVATAEAGTDVDEREWKLLKRGEDFSIFKQRKHQRGADSSLRRTLADFENSGAVPPSDLP